MYAMVASPPIGAYFPYLKQSVIENSCKYLNVCFLQSWAMSLVTGLHWNVGWGSEIALMFTGPMSSESCDIREIRENFLHMNISCFAVIFVLYSNRTLTVHHDCFLLVRTFFYRFDQMSDTFRKPCQLLSAHLN